MSSTAESISRSTTSKLVGTDLPVINSPADISEERICGWRMWADIVDSEATIRFAFNCFPDEKNTNTDRFYDDTPRVLLEALVKELEDRKQPSRQTP